MFKDSMSAVWVTIVLCVCVAIVVLAMFGLNAGLYPRWLGVQRNAVEESKSYVDSANSSLTTYAQEYRALDSKIAEADNNADVVATYKAQQKAIMNSMCQQIASMKANTISPVSSAFVAEHGGC